MKGLQAKDLRGNDPEELRRTLRKLEEDLFRHRLKRNTNQLENTMLIRTTRREIARVNTVLAEGTRGAVSARAPVARTTPAAATVVAAATGASKRAKAAGKTSGKPTKAKTSVKES